MTEVSRPVQIALLAVVLFAVAWFVALKPGDSNEATTAAAPAPAQTTPASAPAAEPTPAKTTAEQAPEPTTQSSAQPTATPATGSVEEVAAVGADRASASVVSTTGTAADPNAALVEVSALPADVRRAISKKQVVVLLFWNRKGADDSAVFRSVKHLNRRGGKVYVKTDSARHVSAYSGITGGAQVLQTPTVIVVDRNKKAITLPGYVDGATIDHVVRIAVS
jgi:hypothetical protein